MTRRLLGIAVLALVALACHTASANILHFDDVTTESASEIPDGYGGMNWENMNVVSRSFAPGSGYDTGAISGDYVAFNAMASPASVFATSTAFTFDGAWLTSAYYNDNVVTVTAYLNDIQVHTNEIATNTSGPQWFDFGYRGAVDQLIFSSSHAQFAMDNFTFSPVPVPGAMWLFGSGLIGLAGIRKTRKIFA